MQHDSTGVDFYCTYCPLYYTRYDTLMVHIKTHLEEEEKIKMLGKKRLFKIEKIPKTTQKASSSSNLTLPLSVVEGDLCLKEARLFLEQLSMNISENCQLNLFDLNLDIEQILCIYQIFGKLNQPVLSD